jgi:hypothetical protein
VNPLSLRDEQLKLMAEVKQRTGSTYPLFRGAFTVSGRRWGEWPLLLERAATAV